jgi:predicted NAD-dependent protein-ADP-ribosyltransferase YbiA (DUF1768 family)
MGGPAYVDGKQIEEFDNFEYTPFIYDGKKYLTSEQAYQSSKFEDQEYAEEIRNTKQNTLVYLMGQDRMHKMKEGFDRSKEMEKILRAKFSIPKLRKMLLETEGEITFPESDPYWEKELGVILMKIREECKPKQGMKTN